MTRIDAPEALLFDLGGVVIDIDFSLAFRSWQAHSRLSPDDVADTFSFDEHYERHERGEITASEYFAHLADLLRLDGDQSQIADGWNSIFVGQIHETSSLIHAAQSRVPCYAFTNTNAVHMDTWSTRFPEVSSLFDGIFASHEIGLRKPQPEAFSYVSDAIGVRPEAIAFFDDHPENVQAASAAGFRAILVTSPIDVRNALDEFQCV